MLLYIKKSQLTPTWIAAVAVSWGYVTAGDDDIIIIITKTAKAMINPILTVSDAISWHSFVSSSRVKPLICGWAAGPPPPPPLAGTCPPWGWGGGWCGGCCIAGCCGATGIGTGGCGPGTGAGGCGFYNWKQQFNAFSIPKHQNITGPKINPNPKP